MIIFRKKKKSPFSTKSTGSTAYIYISFICLQAEPLMKDYVEGLIENSGKFVLMHGILEESLAIGDKVLIFR